MIARPGVTARDGSSRKTMRKITFTQIVTFAVLVTLALVLALLTTNLVFGRIPLGDFRGIFLVVAGICLLYVYAILIHRIFGWFFPLREGEIPDHSSQEFIYHVYILFYLMLFYPVMRSGIPPAPFMRAFYRVLGARLGSNTYSQGIIHDPSFVAIGASSVVGQSALLIPHVIENGRLAHYAIRIGDNVTVGAASTILAGVTIGNDAIVSTGAVVTKGTHIGDGEIWGGVPARMLGRKGSAEVTSNATLDRCQPPR